jgi:hypothetical protein
MFELRPQPPFGLGLVAAALRRQPHNAVDRRDGDCYRRVMSLPAGPVEAAVTQSGGADAPVLELDVCGAEADAR